MTSAAPREPIDPGAVIEALARGDNEAALAMFQGRTEAERRPVGAVLGPLAAQLWYTTRELPRYDRLVPHIYADLSCAAVFACCTLTQVKRLNEHRFGLMCTDLTVDVLVDRRPPWVTAWATWALEQEARPSGRADGLFILVRKLIRAGVCEPLDTDPYILAMLHCDHNYYGPWRRHQALELRPRTQEERFARQRAREAAKRSIRQILLDDPELLDREVWRIFDVRGRPSRELNSSPERAAEWIGTLVTFADEGRLDRSRMLNATLDALTRGLTKRQAGWFVDLWHALQVTPQERTGRQDRLLHLLANPVASPVSLALDELDLLEAAGELDVQSFVTEVEGVLMTQPVALVRKALRLLDRVARDHPESRTDAHIVMTAAFVHANPGVRDAAITSLGRGPRPLAAPVALAVEANIDGLSQPQINKITALLA